MAIPVACDIAAPSPWNMRKNIISNIGDDICSELDKDGEEPANKAIIPNSNIPVMYIGFRPTMSDNLPWEAASHLWSVTRRARPIGLL